MDGQLPAADALPGCGDQLLRERGGLAGGDHSAGHVPAEDVDDDVQVYPLHLAGPAGLDASDQCNNPTGFEC